MLGNLTRSVSNTFVAPCLQCLGQTCYDGGKDGGEEVGDLFVISVIKSSSAEVAYRIGAGTIVTNRISINLWSACQPTTISCYFYSVGPNLFIGQSAEVFES